MEISVQALTLQEMGEERPMRKRKVDQREANKDRPNQDAGTERGSKTDPPDSESAGKEKGRSEWSKLPKKDNKKGKGP